jgi:hypothetical protein
MRPGSRLVVITALLALTAGCTRLAEEMETSRIEADMTGRPAGVRPGLEPLQNRQPPPPPQAEPAERPMIPPESVLPFPTVGIPWALAEAMLAGDPVAQHFFALKRLAARGLVPLDDATARRDDNLGALLPLTRPHPPAAGLDRPVPPSDGVEQRFSQLYDKTRSTPQARKAERDFLLDGLMPPATAPRAALPVPADQTAARQSLARLDRLKDAGLITRPERDEEARELQTLMGSGALPEILTAPLPPPPEPEIQKKPVKKAGPARPAGRMEGGVRGRFEVIPSPPQLSAPKLPAGSNAPAGLHLLSMGTAAHAEKAFEALKKEFPELAPLSYKVSKADLGDLGATYRLIAGPTDSATAEKLCADIRAKGQTCQATPFPQ